METVELFDIGEEKIKGILDAIPIYWYRQKGLPEPSLVPVLRKYVKKNSHILGVHIFAYGKNDIITILSEYLADLKTATFEILETSLSNLLERQNNESIEVRISEIIEEILQEEFPTSIQIFVCPECEAAYIISEETDVIDGMVLCRKCDKSVKFNKNLVPTEL